MFSNYVFVLRTANYVFICRITWCMFHIAFYITHQGTYHNFSSNECSLSRSDCVTAPIYRPPTPNWPAHRFSHSNSILTHSKSQHIPRANNFHLHKIFTVSSECRAWKNKDRTWGKKHWYKYVICDCLKYPKFVKLSVPCTVRTSMQRRWSCTTSKSSTSKPACRAHRRSWQQPRWGHLANPAKMQGACKCIPQFDASKHQNWNFAILFWIFFLCLGWGKHFLNLRTFSQSPGYGSFVSIVV